MKVSLIKFKVYLNYVQTWKMVLLVSKDPLIFDIFEYHEELRCRVDIDEVF